MSILLLVGGLDCATKGAGARRPAALPGRPDQAARYGSRVRAATAILATVLALSLAPRAWSSAAGAPLPRAASAGKRAPSGGKLAPGSRKPASRHKRAAVPKASVSVDPSAAIGPLVPSDFLGLSFEASNLPTLAGYDSSAYFANLLRSLGAGVMRFGGISVDTEAGWADGAPPPAWSHTTISPQDLEGVASLARATGWRVLLGVSFGHVEPAAAAQEAQVAQSLLGASLAGISIGNEPDRYVADTLRTSPWSFADYVSEIAAYRAAIAAAAPGVPIAGPDASTSEDVLAWVSEEAAAEHPALLTAHYYPLTKCEAYPPKLSDLVSPVTRANESAILEQLSAAAVAARIPLRLDETNNVSCRGQPGVSNVFASALWAVDYVARAMASGVAGVNFHDLLGEPLSYSPLVAGDAQELASGALHANPEWYALLLAERLLGDRPVQASVAGSASTLTAGAFVSPSGSVQLVLVDFAPTGAKPLLVQLDLPRSFGAGPILRLTAPGLQATSGVTLGGDAVNAEGTWSPAAALPYVSGKPGALALQMPASSAALVTLVPSS
jgi:hypothetical protein